MREYDLHRNETLGSGDYMVGIPSDPVVAVPKMNVVGSKATHYEGRTYANNGVAVVSWQNPAERAVNKAIRPRTSMIEVGEYCPDDHHDLVFRLSKQLPHVWVDGARTPCDESGPIGVVARVAKAKGARRMVTHELDPRLQGMAQGMGLKLHENAEKFGELGKKSGLTSALKEYRLTHPDTSLVPFGTNVSGMSDVMQEVQRLKEHGTGAYLKLDTVNGIVAAGGEGHLAIPLSMSEEAIYKEVLRITGNTQDIQGVAQMLLSDYKVLSLSSGQRPDGRYVAYEAHEQTVDGNTADGSRPINDPIMREDFKRMWTDVKGFYEYFAVTGDQNMNAMVLTEEDFLKACQIYGPENAAKMVFVDFNYRAISGTKNAMARLQEDTRKRFDPNVDYRSRGIRVNADFATNPHLMFAAGRKAGLHAGRNGNFTVVNMGTFTPDAVKAAQREGEKLKTQVIAQTHDASQAIDIYEALLGGDLSAREFAKISNMPFVHPEQAGLMTEQNYQDIIYAGMREVISYNGKHEKNPPRIVHGNIWNAGANTYV